MSGRADPAQSSSAVRCTCGAGLDQTSDFHAADCPFPQGVCDYCDKPTDGVVNGDTPCCETCFKELT